jgi:hypothetical protein
MTLTTSRSYAARSPRQTGRGEDALHERDRSLAHQGNDRSIVQTPSGEIPSRNWTSGRAEGLHRPRGDPRLGLASGVLAHSRRFWAFRSRGFSRPTMTNQGPEQGSSIAGALRACAAALEQLAVAVEQSTREQPTREGAIAPREIDRGSSWPAVMSTKVAASYCGYKTASALRKAHLDGKVFPVGRRGGVGSLTWSRADLDGFLQLEPRASEGDRQRAPRVDAPEAHDSTSGDPASSPRGAAAQPSAEIEDRRSRGSRPQRRKLSPAVQAALRKVHEIADKARGE